MREMNRFKLFMLGVIVLVMSIMAQAAIHVEEPSGDMYAHGREVGEPKSPWSYVS